jgi:hypothetical protein
MTLKATRTAQTPLVAVFEWNFNDTMVDTSGASKNFGSSDLAITVDAVNLPVNSRVIGGELVVLTAFDTAGYDITIGDATTANRYLTSTDVKATGRTALVPTGYVNAAGENLRLTIASDDACTTGKARLTVEYIIEGRVSEVVPA